LENTCRKDQSFIIETPEPNTSKTLLCRYSLKYTFRHTFFKSLKNAYEIFQKEIHGIQGPSLDFIARLRTFAHIDNIAQKKPNN
jgi:hypothetical protein